MTLDPSVLADSEPFIVTLVVQGRPVEMDTVANCALQERVPQAIARVAQGNPAPIDNWEVRNVHGVEVSLSEPVGSVNYGQSLIPGARLWVHLRAGFGA